MPNHIVAKQLFEVHISCEVGFNIGYIVQGVGGVHASMSENSSWPELRFFPRVSVQVHVVCLLLAPYLCHLYLTHAFVALSGALGQLLSITPIIVATGTIGLQWLNFTARDGRGTRGPVPACFCRTTLPIS